MLCCAAGVVFYNYTKLQVCFYSFVMLIPLFFRWRDSCNIGPHVHPTKNGPLVVMQAKDLTPWAKVQCLLSLGIGRSVAAS